MSAQENGDERAPRRILVVANETVGGRALIDAVKRHADEGPVRVRVVCPTNRPKHGYVVYDDTVEQAVGNRLRLTIEHLREYGVEADGETGDADPFTATMDAVSEHGADEIIISTHPETRSGWMRRDLIDRVKDETGLPVEHVIVDLDADREEVTHALVVASQTVGGDALIEAIRERAGKSRYRFVVVCPQDEGSDDARDRLDRTLERLKEEGLEAVGQVSDPDPYTSVQNALEYYTVDEILISTFPETRSGWLRRDLIERVRRMTSKPVEHVVVDEADAQASDPAGQGQSPSRAGGTSG